MAQNEKEGSITCCGLHTGVVRQTDLSDLILPAIWIVFGLEVVASMFRRVRLNRSTNPSHWGWYRVVRVFWIS